MLHCIKGHAEPGSRFGSANNKEPSMLNFIAQWRNERVAVRELSRLPDHRLADLGIARADITSIARSAASMARNGVGDPASASRRTDPVGVMAPSWANHNRRALA